jgi:segregation and condensation protein B
MQQTTGPQSDEQANDVESLIDHGEGALNDTSVTLSVEAQIEAVVFAAKDPLKVPEIREILADPKLTDGEIQRVLDRLVNEYDSRQGGFRLIALKRLGYQFQTSQAAAPIMARMFASRPRPITRAALETLAIIAYRQPVTRAEIEFIRGVDAGSIIKTLMDRELIRCVGRKDIVGRPMLFGTTDEFLKVFNLSSVKDLPPLESFQPSRETIQGAAAKMADGADLVDIEDYIAAGSEETTVSHVEDVADEVAEGPR